MFDCRSNVKLVIIYKLKFNFQVHNVIFSHPDSINNNNNCRVPRLFPVACSEFLNYAPSLPFILVHSWKFKYKIFSHFILRYKVKRSIWGVQDSVTRTRRMFPLVKEVRST